MRFISRERRCSLLYRLYGNSVLYEDSLTRLFSLPDTHLSARLKERMVSLVMVATMSWALHSTFL